MKKRAMVYVLWSMLAFLPVMAFAGDKVTVLHSFGRTPTDGDSPHSPLVFDKAGNLYGVTFQGGRYGWGTVFELTKKSGGSWTQKMLYSFRGWQDGTHPNGALVFDLSGNLYGTASAGGKGGHGHYGPGVVFELTPTDHGEWKETVVHTFGVIRSDGLYPLPGVIFDGAGSLYGSTYGGGSLGGGTVFQLTPQPGGDWSETILRSFDFNQEGSPQTGLTMDRFGNLYGITDKGPVPSGSFGGVVFELSPEQGDQWSYTSLHTFPGYDKNGHNPSGDATSAQWGVILDDEGNLYGTSTFGGRYDLGTVFEIPAGQGANGTDKILYSFSSADHGGTSPNGGLVFDAVGNLYGTTNEGGPYVDIFGVGKIFEMMPPDAGEESWTMKALHIFGGFKNDGRTPAASMVLGPDGNLYGTTDFGGYHPETPKGDGGTVFEVTLP